MLTNIRGTEKYKIEHMKSYYQLIFLGDTTCSACRKVKERFFELLKERGFGKSLIAILDGSLTLARRDTEGYDPTKPTFAFYFGMQGHGDKDVDALRKLIKNRDAVYPIFFTDFKQEVPKVLHPFNGTIYVENKLDNIVNVAFEELRLLRKKRRVFISYKRSESVAVANQLYDALSRHQFDVFLDTYSIRGAADFQAELYHRITDSDVLIQLNSPGFMDSKWCKEEISEANARQVGVLQLNWPNVSESAADHLCVSRKLYDADFRYGHHINNASKLKKVVLDEIVMKVEALRARNIAAREDSLTAEFAKEAELQGRRIVKEAMFLVESRPDGKIWYYIPAIGVPQSMDYYESSEILKKWVQKNKIPDKVFLIYDDLRILPRWISHLDWMNNYLTVKSIKKQEFTTWIKSTK